LPDDGDFADLLWADPVSDDAALNTEFELNENRSCSYFFGLAPLKRVLKAT